MQMVFPTGAPFSLNIQKKIYIVREGNIWESANGLRIVFHFVLKVACGMILESVLFSPHSWEFPSNSVIKGLLGVPNLAVVTFYP